MLLTFGFLIFVGVPQPKPMHGFLADLQNLFTQTGSRADLVLEGNLQQLLPW